MKIQQMTRQDLEMISIGPAVLVAGPNGPEWVTDYTLYQDRGEIVARREDGMDNGTFEDVLCGPEIAERLSGEGPWTIGVAMSAKDVAALWEVDVDAIVFRGMIIIPRDFLPV